MAMGRWGGGGGGSTLEVGGGLRGKSMIGLVVGVVVEEEAPEVGEPERAGDFHPEIGEEGKGCQTVEWGEVMAGEGVGGAIDRHQTGTYILRPDALQIQRIEEFRASTYNNR